MLLVPDAMSKVNQFIYADIPSAKDLYNKMGFRYVNGSGHSDVQSALDSAPCMVNVNASSDVSSLAQSLIEQDIEILKKQDDLPK